MPAQIFQLLILLQNCTVEVIYTSCIKKNISDIIGCNLKKN